jgi:DNA polymerase type B, organellar and viral
LKRLPAQLYIPTEEEEAQFHSIICCILRSEFDKLWSEKKIPQDLEEKIKIFPKLGFDSRFRHGDIEKICDIMRVDIVIHIVETKHTHKFFKKESSFGKHLPGSSTIELAHQNSKWGLVLKREELFKHYFCNTCSRWKKYDSEKKFAMEHLADCCRCGCERAFKKGDVHPITCRKASYKKAKPPKKNVNKVNKNSDAIKGHVPYMDYQHFADFETFPRKKDNKYRVYAAGLLEFGSEEVWIGIGNDSLEDFMKRILKLTGILWFFNGSKFDNFFILDYILRNNIPIDRDETIICNKQILVLTIMTEHGKLIIKDFAKFVVGSLDSNCKTFGIPVDSSKTSFNHNKIKSFHDVTTHSEEIGKYLRLDVIALKCVYAAYAKEVADDFGIMTSKYVSMAQLSHVLWTTKLPDDLKLFKTKTKTQLPDFKASFFGGRVPVITPIAQCYDFEYVRQFWQCLDDMMLIDDLSQENFNKLFEIYAESSEGYKYYDINSLYPSQMFGNLYPCGECYLVERIGDRLNEFIIQEIFKEVEIDKAGHYEMKIAKYPNPKKDGKEEEVNKLIYVRDQPMKWIYRLLKVDLDCPKDIYIPFVMHRDPKTKRNVQNLENKREHWITGGELIEAIIIGYKLIKVHKYWAWDDVKDIFSEYIEYTNKKKSLAERESAAYNFAKIMANALYGKHGQDVIQSSTILLIGDEMETEKIIKHNQKNIYNEEGFHIAAMLEQEKEQEYTNFSFHFSSFIVANARVWMSRYTRMIDGYRNINHVPIEGDTDSLVIPKVAIDALKARDLNLYNLWHGPHLAQMKDEMPKDVLLGQVNIAPKTKFKVYLTQMVKDGLKKTVCRGFFKSKGIQHTREPYDPFLKYDVSEMKKFEVLLILDFLRARSSSTNKETKKFRLEDVTFKEPFFVRYEKDSEGNNIEEHDKIKVTDRLNWDDLVGIVTGKYNIVSIFAGMVRNLKDIHNVDDMGIFPDYIQRSVSVNNWWENGKNRMIDPTTWPYGITKPIGFI